MKARQRRGLFRAQTTLMHFVLGSHPLRPLRSSKNQPCPVRAQNRRRGAAGECRNDPSTPRHRSCRCAPRYASCGSCRKRRLAICDHCALWMTTHPIRWSSGCRSCHGKTWLCLLPFPIIQNPATARERSGNVAMTTQRNARSVPVNCLERESLLCTSRRIADSYKRSEVRTGDLVMAIRATVGKVLPVPCDLDGANLTQGTARIALSVRTNPSFLLWVIRHHRAQKSILAEIMGTTFAEITLADLRQVPLAAPIEFEEQRLIGQRVQACDDAIQCEQRQLVKLRAQKSGLMDDLLTGRVRVTPLLEAATA